MLVTTRARYGTLRGKVASNSPDAMEDEKLGLVYLARIQFERTSDDRSGRILRLTPGMRVQADVRTGERSIASFLIGPIDQVRQEAGRER